MVDMKYMPIPPISICSLKQPIMPRKGKRKEKFITKQIFSHTHTYIHTLYILYTIHIYNIYSKLPTRYILLINLLYADWTRSLHGWPNHYSRNTTPFMCNKVSNHIYNISPIYISKKLEERKRKKRGNKFTLLYYICKLPPTLHCFSCNLSPTAMASEKVETVVAGNYVEMEREEEGKSTSAKSKFSRMFWHGGSVYDAWFSCASNQAIYLFFLIGSFMKKWIC